MPACLDGVSIARFCSFNRPIRILARSTQGTLGAGAIGQALGRVGLAIGVTVKYNGAIAKTEPAGGELVSQEALRDMADVLSCHRPCSDEIRGMIGAGIDMTATEPTPRDSAIMQLAHLPNVIATPSVRDMQTLCDQLIANIDGWKSGAPVNLVVPVR